MSAIPADRETGSSAHSVAPFNQAILGRGAATSLKVALFSSVGSLPSSSSFPVVSDPSLHKPTSSARSLSCERFSSLSVSESGSGGEGREVSKSMMGLSLAVGTGRNLLVSICPEFMVSDRMERTHLALRSAGGRCCVYGRRRLTRSFSLILNADSEADDETPYEKIVSHQPDETIWRTEAREDGGCTLAKTQRESILQLRFGGGARQILCVAPPTRPPTEARQRAKEKRR